ncbi:HD domain-containing protein [Curtobacterium sp. PhB191]|uniref:HD domain-containing protein n=1 Tax=Curtobacterium sp. PhB191 TaxID=2485202 RepID=UPI00104E735C|nr:HD domain-containing protein [Curtobacterium sp. PhB191]
MSLLEIAVRSDTVDGDGREAIVHGDAIDTLGNDGVFFDPLWRIEVSLTETEQRLLRTWPVRRLAFIAHAGAASITTVQTYSRLEHSLGVLALVAHFASEDHPSRIAALLHDVGHLPFSHTLEGLAGLDHHRLTRQRITAIFAADVTLDSDAETIIALDDGSLPSALTAVHGGLKLDHLDSFLRSGQAHGRTRSAPQELLRRLRLRDGAVDADPVDAVELTDLAIGEAHAQRSAANLVPVAVVRGLVSRLLGTGALEPTVLAGMTDDELWSLLLSADETRVDAASLRRHPQHWYLRRHRDNSHGAPFSHVVRRSYLDLPMSDGQPTFDPRVDALQQDLPMRVSVQRTKGQAPVA